MRVLRGTLEKEFQGKLMSAFIEKDVDRIVNIQLNLMLMISYCCWRENDFCGIQLLYNHVIMVFIYIELPQFMLTTLVDRENGGRNQLKRIS
ncbi:hypothetical protein T07_310 [Trichinella nelsoni]|uniref:Uncharacterized protein n=1 Tax=Trichinella nelsoni TaxID=6336 RepID=A0A0V0RY16_9BILA|nr:hypothetical protein T07_310 [Trichinella nelsoni]